MKTENSYPYYLRSSATPDFKGYPNLAEARLALDNLINAQSIDASSITEEPDGKWVIRHGSKDSVKIWIEDDKFATVPLKLPPSLSATVAICPSLPARFFFEQPVRIRTPNKAVASAYFPMDTVIARNGPFALPARSLYWRYSLFPRK